MAFNLGLLISPPFISIAYVAMHDYQAPFSAESCSSTSANQTLSPMWIHTFP